MPLFGGRVPTVLKEAGRKIYTNMSVWPTQPVNKKLGNNTPKSNKLNFVDSFFKY